jgi:hypothetical protein
MISKQERSDNASTLLAFWRVRVDAIPALWVSSTLRSFRDYGHLVLAAWWPAAALDRYIGQLGHPGRRPTAPSCATMSESFQAHNRLVNLFAFLPQFG